MESVTTDLAPNRRRNGLRPAPTFNPDDPHDRQALNFVASVADLRRTVELRDGQLLEARDLTNKAQAVVREQDKVIEALRADLARQQALIESWQRRCTQLQTLCDSARSTLEQSAVEDGEE